MRIGIRILWLEIVLNICLFWDDWCEVKHTLFLFMVKWNPNGFCFVTNTYYDKHKKKWKSYIRFDKKN